MSADDVKSPRFIKFLDRMLVSPAEKIARQTESMGRKCCGDGLIIPESSAFSPGVLWEGVFAGWSGYAKANREIMLRVANSLHVETLHAIKPGWTYEPAELRLAAHERTRVSFKCPFLRFFGPDAGELPRHRHRILWTMMETEVVHPDMVSEINRRYHELWVPTRWGADAFRRSGLSIPVSVSPLGVNSIIYRPIESQDLPSCKLLSTDRAGKMEKPSGFTFISVGIPSFRKGFDVLSSAFEDAFAGDPDVSLVCAVTHASSNVEQLASCAKMKSRIYALEGSFDEYGMAKVYNACDAYVTASRGEGWNLPLCEAAACGLPVICPRNTTHPEVAGQNAFFFSDEGQGAIPGAESISPWYRGVPFSIFGKKSHAELVDLLRAVKSDSFQARKKAAYLRQRMLTELTWDKAAEIVAYRLLGMQG